MAKITVEVKGMVKVLADLSKLGPVTEQGAFRGLLAGGLLIQRRAQKRTPVEYGLLRASAYTRKAQDGTPTVEVGYTAKYARWVHDKTQMKLRGKPRRSGIGTYWNPGEAQFLKKAYDESIRDVIGLVEKFIKKDQK